MYHCHPKCVGARIAHVIESELRDTGLTPVSIGDENVYMRWLIMKPQIDLGFVVMAETMILGEQRVQSRQTEISASSPSGTPKHLQPLLSTRVRNSVLTHFYPEIAPAIYDFSQTVIAG